MQLEHWHIHRDDEGVAWLSLDQRDSAGNVLTHAVLEELDQAIIGIAQSHPLALVIQSAKRNGFIAGADVKAFAEIDDPAEAEKIIRRAHGIFARIEALSFPSLALIHGYCLGGGLELALACRYRIVSDDAATRLGFPEVRLGIFPGFGGTVRATRLIGDLPALKLMLTGRSVDGRKARRLGLVDMCVPQRQLRAAAHQLLLQRPAPQRPGLLKRLPGHWPLRPLTARLMLRQLRKRVNLSHYPAPAELIDHWAATGRNPLEMYHSEAERVSSLLTGDTAQNLVRVFMLQDRLKGLGKTGDFDCRHVHVIGGGMMGGDIAAWCALRGLQVTLQDRTPADLSRAIKRARQLFEHKLRKPRLVRAAMDRLIPDTRAEGVSRADVVIEAIFEDVEAKQSLYAQIERHLKPEAVLATNTSSIPLQTLSQRLADPTRLVGLHFFNPVAKMPLLEVVHGNHSSPEMLRRALAFARRIDKLPLPVRSTPGFLVNRVLMPYLLEAVNLLEEGVPAPVIDKAALHFGMPMGPVELADTVGLDICLSVAEKLSHTLHNKVPERLRMLVEQGKLGRKSGAGFYQYKKGRLQRPQVARGYQPPDDIEERLLLRLINESMACLREGVVEDADLLDAGIIFGTGFAPFRGGPMHYADQRGRQQTAERLAEMEQAHGEHFHADQGWVG